MRSGYHLFPRSPKNFPVACFAAASGTEARHFYGLHNEGVQA